ncbi:MAG TPA: heavy metal sensor histidine kinase [Dehalococcoidia bacterium]
MTLLRSLRLRLTLWYVLLLAVTLAVFSAGVYLALRENLRSNLDSSLDARASIVAGLVTDTGGLDVGGVEFDADVDDEEFTRIFDSSGAAVLDSSGAGPAPAVDSAAVERALRGEETRRTGRSAGDESLRFLVAPVRYEGEVVGAVEVGLTDEDVSETLRSLLVIIAIAYPLVLGVTSAGGLFLAGRALSPIDRVTRVAQRISAEDLSQRLDLDLPDDEVGRLARTFDEMIERLDGAFKRQRQFTADASHELRTPLTAIKGQTEVALQRDRAPEDYREVLRGVNSEVDRMIRLVGSLLTLARADAARITINREQLSARTLVTDAVEQVRPSASEKGLAMTVKPGDDVGLVADQDLVLQLLLNLLDNAVKYTPAGGSVDVSWRAADGQAEIAIADSGPGIPEEHLPRIFDRFYRADVARSREEGGAGLGLAICRWIAEAHGGSIEAMSGPEGGATFTVRLPAA